MHGFTRRNAIRGLALLGACSPLTAGMRSLAAEHVPLAIRGYDPVAYFTLGTATRGQPEFDFVWDEHRYLFAGAEHRALFRADPVRYAPQFANFCAMALSLGQVVEADPENWLISEGKLYVFGKPAPAGPTLFQKDLAGNITRANQNRPIVLKR